MPMLRAIVTAAVAAGLLFALVGFGHLLPWHRDLSGEPLKSAQQSALLEPANEEAQQDGKEKPAKACARCEDGKERHKEKSHGKGHWGQDGKAQEREEADD